MRYPHFLPDGGTIGFVAPSFGAYIEPYHTCFLRSLEVFQEMDYRVELGPNVFKGDGIGISTDPRDCGKELTESYADQKSDILISVGGGELMCETMSHVDLQEIAAAEPKWYLGYSDNTNFGFLLATMFDTASVYGPCASDFSMDPWHASLHDCMGILTGKSMTEDGKLVVHGYEKWEKDEIRDEDRPFAPYNCTEETAVTCRNWDGTPVSGRFVGGCLDILVNLCGTRFDHVKEFAEKYKEDGIIWFLEACDLEPFSIRRALWELKEAGWFRYAKGFLIGRPLHYEDVQMGLDRFGAVMGILDEFDVPVVMDCDLGHLPPMMPMINGGYGTLMPYGEKNVQVLFELK